MEIESSSLDFSRGHKEEKDDGAGKRGMIRVNTGRSIKSSESTTGHRMGSMDQLSNAYEGEEKLHPQTFGMRTVVW
jgi:hypothetical protein